MKENASPMATDASNQSTTVFYRKFIYLQFCKVGIFMGIWFLPKQSGVILCGTSSPQDCKKSSDSLIFKILQHTNNK